MLSKIASINKLQLKCLKSSKELIVGLAVKKDIAEQKTSIEKFQKYTNFTGFALVTLDTNSFSLVKKKRVTTQVGLRCEIVKQKNLDKPNHSVCTLHKNDNL